MFKFIQKICFLAVGVLVIQPVFAQENVTPQDVQEIPVVENQGDEPPVEPSPDGVQPPPPQNEEQPTVGSETEPCVACGMG